jgi:type II secretory pathway pseudopilin PulG
MRVSRRLRKHTRPCLRVRAARNEKGIQLVELLVAVVIGGILMASAFNSATAMYRFSSSGENQVLATNVAQQVIDNARNSRYVHLRDTILGGNASKTEVLSLYTYPSSPSTSMFPRPLLRDESEANGMTYDDASVAKRFNGTVTQTLTNLTPGNATNGLIRVDVVVNWNDSRGPHNYRTGTTISQNGIHN